jgi:hypothetical protein
MAWTQGDLDRIERAIASGVTSVTYANGQRVQYADMEALRRARQDIIRALRGSRRPRQFRLYSSRGLD